MVGHFRSHWTDRLNGRRDSHSDDHLKDRDPAGTRGEEFVGLVHPGLSVGRNLAGYHVGYDSWIDDVHLSSGNEAAGGARPHDGHYRVDYEGEEGNAIESCFAAMRHIEWAELGGRGIEESAKGIVRGNDHQKLRGYPDVAVDSTERRRRGGVVYDLSRRPPHLGDVCASYPSYLSSTF